LTVLQLDRLWHFEIYFLQLLARNEIRLTGTSVLLLLHFVAFLVVNRKRVDTRHRLLEVVTEPWWEHSSSWMAIKLLMPQHTTLKY